MKGNRSPKRYRLSVFLVAAFLASTLYSVPSIAQSNSQVRIVRLSFVEGTVTMYRPDVDEWAQAFVNTPIQHGFKVATDANSFAEVEFENGSTVRLGQSSELDFTNLSLSPEGGKINRMALARGYATFAVMPEKDDVYQIQAAGSTYSSTAQSMFRIDMDQNSQRLEVFKGEVAVRSPYGSGTIAKNQVVELEPGNANPFRVTEGVTEDDWDRWVSKRQQTQTVASNKGAPGGSGLPAGSSLYGWNDLSYFGAWNDLAGYGSCWSPTMGAGWSPYSIGRWSYYPGMGYTWISGLPWGWLPFHYGSWVYPAGYGWCWLPGNFSYWSPGLVTWYQGPNWVGWAPMPYSGGSGTRALCPSGQNCSTVVSLNTFQSGRPISPKDVLGMHGVRGRSVASPTAPLTRNLRLPGPALTGSPFASTNDTGGSSGVRARRIGAAPTRVFARGTIPGPWDVQPHASAFRPIQGNAANRERRMHGAVTTSGRSTNSFRGNPAVNNDMLLPSRTALGRATAHPGVGPRQLTSLPISSERTRGGAIHHSSSLVPSARPSGNEAGMRSFQEPRMPVFRQERFPRNRSMENSQSRRQMQMNQRSNMSQQRVQSAPASRPSSGGFGGERTMGQSHESMGGGMRGGMGGGMSGGEGGSRGPHH
jgi:Family of unknown function (DUF6600)/FecR protein